MDIYIPHHKSRQRFVTANLAEYGDLSRELNFVTTQTASDAEARRAAIIGTIGNKLQFDYAQTKPFLHAISPGCRICGAGTWSCLFINGKCNCRCFYCPTTQNDISVPTTNRLMFRKPSDYGDYVVHFGFQGVSISGGEPLLTFDKTVNYIRAVRKHNPDHIYIWMYTNGVLMTQDYILKLKDAGLNEIRFDIGATGYDLKKLLLAIGRIPTVTVEIPAIPEDMDRLKALIPEMAAAGVNYLNLHQLRLTPHNSDFLKSRGYTFLHGPRVTVLESELSVLSLFATAIENGWTLPINYCAFAYKNQFQQAAARKRSAAFIVKPFESITGNGYIRSMSVNGDRDKISNLLSKLKRHDISQTLYQINRDMSQLIFHETLWPLVGVSDLDLFLNYSEAILSPALSYRFPFKEIRLKGGLKLFVEKHSRQMGIRLTPGQTAYFQDRVIQKIPHPQNAGSDHEWMDFEFIREGLQTYF